MTTESTFSSLGLGEPLLRALREMGHLTPTPIQAQAIPLLLNGEDLIGNAQTGTGKTGAFALPILQKLANNPTKPGPWQASALVLAPTRELATQVEQSFRQYGKYLPLKTAVVYGGVGYGWQIRALAQGVDVLVATPGRLKDHLERNHVNLSATHTFVLDEADRMLDQGFIPDARLLAALLPKGHQSLMFSATMSPPIRQLAGEFLHQPRQISVSPQKMVVDTIAQGLMYVDRNKKQDLLHFVLSQYPEGNALVFVNRKEDAEWVAAQLTRDGINASAIHGGKSQFLREKILRDFRTGNPSVLVASDVAARGLQIDGISVVVNFNPPMDPEAYVHRTGRTGRAGADGVAITFCDPAEYRLVRNIERLMRQPIPVIEGHPFSTSNDQPASAPRYAAAARNENRASIPHLTHSLPPAPTQPARRSPLPEPEPVRHEAEQPRQRFPQRDNYRPFVHDKDRALDYEEALKEQRSRKHKKRGRSKHEATFFSGSRGSGRWR